MGAAEALGGFEEDRLRNAVGIGGDVAVPEADDGPAFIDEPGGAVLVAAGVDVLAAVDLDDQLRLPQAKSAIQGPMGSWRVKRGR